NSASGSTTRLRRQLGTDANRRRLRRCSSSWCNSKKGGQTMQDIVFDGDAISQADRDFLASLDDHPLKQNPLYGVPCPSQPDFGTFDPKDKNQATARLAFYETVVAWLLANFAYREGAFMGLPACPTEPSRARGSLPGSSLPGCYVLQCGIFSGEPSEEASDDRSHIRRRSRRLYSARATIRQVRAHH